jgi:hypothetical protein
MDRFDAAKETLECLLYNESKDFFERYDTREEAWEAWKNVSHTFVALCIMLGKDEKDFAEWLDENIEEDCV